MPSTSGSANLEYLRNQAKDLLRAARAADPHACARLATHLPKLVGLSPASSVGRTLRLSHAQFVIARENGYASWPRLKAAILSGQYRPVLPAPGSRPQPSADGQSPTGSRTLAHMALAREIAGLAARDDAGGLAARFSRMPLRDILAVRQLLVARGTLPRLVTALLSGLQCVSPRVRYDCAHALDHFADERCVGPLRGLLDDPVPRVRRIALHVLTCDVCKLAPLPASDDLGSRIIQLARSDPSINVRRHSVVALGGCWQDARVGEVLEALITQETDSALRREARHALRRHAAQMKSVQRGDGATATSAAG